MIGLSAPWALTSTSTPRTFTPRKAAEKSQVIRCTFLADLPRFGMRMIFPYRWILSVLAGLGMAFWAGRASAPENSANLAGSNRLGAGVAGRQPRQNAKAGGGGQAVTSALQLRGVFKNCPNPWLAGTAVDAKLAKMNGSQLSQLVRDLATAQATTPGYSFGREINAACVRWAEVDPDAALRFALSNKQASFRNTAIPSMIAGIAKNDPALALAKLAAINEPTLRRAAQSCVMYALGGSSPDEWVAAVKADPSLARQNGGAAPFAADWAMDDPVAAAKRIMQLPADMQKNGVVAIARVWAGKDSPAATAWAQALTDPQQRSQALAAIAGGIAAQDPDAALASLNSLSPAARRSGLVAVFNSMADLDFDAALAKATSLTDPAERKTALSLLAGGGVGRGDMDYYSIGSSPEQLSAALAELPSGSQRHNALNQLGNQLGRCSSEEAAAILADYPPQDREKLQLVMLQNLSYSDPTRALEIYQTLPPGKRESYGSSIYSSLARLDPEAVLKLMADKSPKEQAQGVGDAFAQLALNDPEAATRRLNDYPAGPVRDAAVARLANTWALDDPAAAKAWVATLSGTEQNRALSSLIPSMAGTDPKGAADMLGKLLATAPKDTDNNLENATSSLVSTWGRDDPESAATWTATLADGNLKNNAISNLASSWAREDFDAAGKWLDTLPDGQARDMGVSSMVYAKSNSDPATAFAWAATIGDNSRRVSLLSSVVQQWKDSDPDKARAAVQQADLTSAERDGLLKQLK